MTTLTEIQFSKLVPCDEINAREDTKDGIAELAASIKARGLIQPLAVRPTDGERYEIIDGRRRYRALALLVKDKARKKGDTVPVIVRNEDDAEALATSLIANTQRLPMHPVDQFAVFDRLAAQGRTEAQIASEFALPERTVRQRLALGRLAPEIRKAWKAGKLEEKVARAFTLHQNQDVQRAAFEKLRKSQGQYLSEHSVRHELASGRRRLAGIPQGAIDRYVAAGGRIAEDLFSDDTLAEDGALLATSLTQWADAETDGIKQRLIGQGWAWVARHKELGVGDWAWQEWPHVIGGEDTPDPQGMTFAVDPEDADTQSAKFTPEQRARSGVVIEFYVGADTQLHFGIMKPSDQADIEDAIDEAGEDGAADDLPPVSQVIGGADADDDAAPRVNNALLLDLTTAQTEAAADAIARHPRIALRALLASLLASPWEAPAKLRCDGYIAQRHPRATIAFASTVQAVMVYDDDAVAAALATHIGRALDLRAFNGTADRSAGLLVDLLPAADYLAAMRERFSPDDYFKRATKAHALDAIDEMREAGCADGIAPVDILADMKKGDLATTAATAAKACGWLPPELRHQDYSLVVASDTPAASRPDATGQPGAKQEAA